MWIEDKTPISSDAKSTSGADDAKSNPHLTQSLSQDAGDDVKSIPYLSDTKSTSSHGEELKSDKDKQWQSHNDTTPCHFGPAAGNPSRNP